tara:strand:- start:1202 stop:1831 length:630 start_codon:yes stop_codon:yes gene_type:complete
MKYCLPLLLFISLYGFSQNSLEKNLDSIASSEDAKTFLKAHKPEDGKLYTYNKEKHKTQLANDLFRLSEGGKKVVKAGLKKTFYKVINKDIVDHYKFSFIIIDGKTSSNRSAKIIRDKILAEYNSGKKFSDLAKHHSSGNTAKTDGDAGWIKQGEISEAFDKEAFIKTHTLNDVFKVDDVENKKFYLVMRTADKKPIEEITVLRFTEEI